MAQARTLSAQQHMAPLAEVLASVAEELEHARILGLRVEGAICGIAVRSSIDGQVVSELQQLDAALQHIAALRDYLGEVARIVEPRLQVDTAMALERVTLGEVRRRLSGGYLNDDPNDVWEML